ncbi:Protein FAR1-RELATED SEQUENCE 5 [Abeliophyllum distichum]|uniref:Protein FAR1-RELATED SEQUENCE 5 n=1 Tax=Abeliophyllum distichum TaxID=126358 RepID=A0ABD1VWK4_9LAMI
MQRVEERRRGSTRVGCNSRLSIVKQQTGNLWVVNKFVAEHNHALTTPSRVHLLRLHRTVEATKKALAQQFSDVNILTCQQLRLVEIDAGGPASIGYMERDLRNHERDIREQLRGHDAETLIEYFSLEKKKSPNFYFDYETDSENTFVRCFWADSESRRSYKCFGEAVVFDTTYNTNKYSMVFAHFVRVNHHGQMVLFGCGLLSNESTESFVWLLSKYLDVMSGQAPHIIITYQDAAIAKSISMVLPLTFHMYCMWHILNNFSEKMNVMVHNEEYHMLVNIIKNSESPDEFEARWSAIMESTNLGCNEWLCSMYDLRFRWTKNAKVSVCEDPSTGISDKGSSSTSLMSRHGMLAHKSSLLVDDAALTDAHTTFLIGEFEYLHVRIKEIDDGGNVTVAFNRSRSKSREESHAIHGPCLVRAKGCEKRLKSSKEKSLSKNTRQCGGCGQHGHDKRTCPKLVDRACLFQWLKPTLHGGQIRRRAVHSINKYPNPKSPQIAATIAHKLGISSKSLATKGIISRSPTMKGVFSKKWKGKGYDLAHSTNK